MGRFLESLKKIWGYIKGGWKYFLPAIVLMLLTSGGYRVGDGLGGALVLLFAIFAFFAVCSLSLFASFFGGVQAENKAKKIMLPAFMNMAFYFFFLFGILNDIFYIPFYYLNPAYYKFQSECKKLPKPVIYNQDYWEAFTDDSKLKKVKNGGGRYSAKLDKTFYPDNWFKEEKINVKETWWGNIRVAQRIYDGVHFATTTAYYYNGLVFRFGVKKISFGYEKLICANYEYERK